MHVVIRLNCCKVPKYSGERLFKLEFRGVEQHSEIIDSTLVNQKFQWPLQKCLESGDLLIVQLLGHQRHQSDKTLGYYTLSMDRVVTERRVHFIDSFSDINDRSLPITIDLDVEYVNDNEEYTDRISLMSSRPESPLNSMDERQMLLDVEQNIANLEKTFTNNKYMCSDNIDNGSIGKTHKKGFFRYSSFHSVKESSLVTERKSSRSMMFKKGVKNLMRIGKQRTSQDKEILVDSDESTNAIIATNFQRGHTTDTSDLSSDNESHQSIQSDSPKPRKPLKHKDNLNTIQNGLKSQDFQVCITVIEARQLAGLNMDPVVCVQVGEVKKYTSVKESTNCPYYNEYFVFDFHMPTVILFDKIITLSVLHSKKILRSGTVVGSFKIDLCTVYNTHEHQFYHKWALLTDPDDVAGGPKGYLKCDISVIGKGDTIKIPPKTEKDEDDIEANLLLPDGMPVDRQRAKYMVRIYRADGLPKMNSTLVANVKKAFTGETRDLVDSFVQVSFAGLTGKTSVRKHSYSPVWNEQIVFSEMFPPLCQRIKIQLRDNDPVNTIIGTHFVDLKTISNDGEKGFPPTFGPTFIHLYGSTRDYSILDKHATLNTGLGEGVSYRARLLVAIRTEITENSEIMNSGVDIEPTYPITETSYCKNEDFFLFMVILDASMIDKKLGEKSIFFELSIGNAGNMIDGHNESSFQEDYDTINLLESVVSESWQSTTAAIKPVSNGKTYHYLPLREDKPCLHVKSTWPDYRRRMYNSNIINKISDKLEEGLNEVAFLIDDDDADKEDKLKSVLDELSSSCNHYVNFTKGVGWGEGSGKTKLDKERMKMCLREIEQVGKMSRNLKAIVTKSSFKERYKTAHGYLQKIKILIEDPQHSLPDIFLWMVSNGKRVAYQRIMARHLIYSIADDECGKFCSKVHSMFLKLPGKKNYGASGWSVPAKLQVYTWLGLVKHKKYLSNGLPSGYSTTPELLSSNNPRLSPPAYIHYREKYMFQLRAYIYQARSLIGSDASGLSDPYAQIIFGEHSAKTQVIDETLSPTWDELLIIDELTLYGTKEDIKKHPPTVVIEIFDQDKVGKSEFIGRTSARPHVKLLEDDYVRPDFPPSLEWYDVHRGLEHAGELLATFELLQLPNALIGESAILPPLPDPKDVHSIIDSQNYGPILPIPHDIRPTLAKYRIEVLFWGLRDLKRIHLMTVDKPRVDIECAGHILYSSIIQNAKKNPNFNTPVKFLELELPEQELYRPPLTIRAVDCRSFGRFTLVGTHLINSIHKYMYVPTTKREREALERKKSLKQLQDINVKRNSSNFCKPYKNNIYSNKHCTLQNDHDFDKQENIIYINYGSSHLTQKDIKTQYNKNRKQSFEEVIDVRNDDSRDWWTKYFASVENAIIKDNKKLLYGNSDMLLSVQVDKDKNEVKSSKKGTKASRLVAKLSPKKFQRKQDIAKIATMKIYPNELEAQPEFNGFREWLLPFDLYRGKKTGDDIEDDARIVGTFKGSIKVYKWPLPKDIEDHTIMGFDPQYGFFQGLPSNDPIHVLVRVYIVKASDLHPMDINGKADPYVVLQLGSKKISDKDNYISKQLNPVFGKCFEIEATFPQDSMLTVQILDWDLLGSDDLIGETRIDLENRFYSRHRATCGLPKTYELLGYNRWRDSMKPTQILAKLCKEAKLDTPNYMNGTIKIGSKIFCLQNNSEDTIDWYCAKGVEEHLALAVLHNWHEIPKRGCHLVPEHIETRPLFIPDKAGIERGKLEMWVDMFPMDMPLPGPALDISPRKPKFYQLRVIIWNTDDVVLEDDAFFTGEKMSDIYVKGWLKGPEDCQSTDIHYRSLTGEGNFNWRFLFPFDYLVAEEKIVSSKKESLFSWDETESKIPARLELQVWDADHFSADDFLGALTLDLNNFPRGAKSSKLCTLDMLKSDGSVPMVNIFKQKRVKGWWPFYVKKENEEMELTGKVEAEIHLLTAEEAEKIPAGIGRNEPDPLDKPNRPDASFMWFLNPFKSIRYIIWHNYKWKILKGFVVLAIFLMLILFFYAIPGYSVKKMLGA
ncbi:otoferlin-like isoform X2 [Daktulosphaira vitifoliae]|uniref:otoferlin-like isoform X2 n=1 Tax=Daktulosphaira vitifoliae TaxID=58002 RepID=UPI0021A9919C|nr:otoferlin-like isoform X2 [Daktulosphaira vitifoliae]